MTLVIKTQTDLTNDTVARLTGLGFTDAQYANTAARKVVDTLDAKLAAFYQDLQASEPDHYLSQAAGAALDALGMLVGCFRRMGETDQNYRVRISQGYQSQSGATTAAMLGALLQLSNVRDVIVKPFTQGAGTLSFYLLPVTAPISSATITAAQNALAGIAAGGAFITVTTPTARYLNLTGTSSLRPSAASASANGNAIGAIAKYIANLSMGETFILDQAIAAALGADSSLLDVTFLTLSTTDVNGVTTDALLRDYTPLFDEELQPGTILIS